MRAQACTPPCRSGAGRTSRTSHSSVQVPRPQCRRPRGALLEVKSWRCLSSGARGTRRYRSPSCLAALCSHELPRRAEPRSCFGGVGTLRLAQVCKLPLRLWVISPPVLRLPGAIWGRSPCGVAFDLRTLLPYSPGVKSMRKTFTNCSHAVPGAPQYCSAPKGHARCGSVAWLRLVGKTSRLALRFVPRHSRDSGRPLRGLAQPGPDGLRAGCAKERG